MVKLIHKINGSSYKLEPAKKIVRLNAHGSVGAENLQPLPGSTDLKKQSFLSITFPNRFGNEQTNRNRMHIMGI